jgi:hypothetical protein
MSRTTMDSWYSRRFGITTPTPLPERVGAARMTNCCPESRTRSLPHLPTTIPLGNLWVGRLWLVGLGAKRDSPWRERRFLRKDGRTGGRENVERQVISVCARGPDRSQETIKNFVHWPISSLMEPDRTRVDGCVGLTGTDTTCRKRSLRCIHHIGAKVRNRDE